MTPHSAPLASRVPPTGRLPGCFSHAMVQMLLLALPRPLPGADLRAGVFEALELVRLLAPRDGLEAHLVVQIVLTMLWGPAAYALAAAHEGDLKMMLALERMAMGYERRGGALRRQLMAYRKQRGVTAWAEPEDAWEYDVAAMTTVWCAGMREMAAVVVGTEPAMDAAEVPVGEGALTAEAGNVSRPVRRAEERRARKLREQAAKREAMLRRIAARADRLAVTAA